MMYKHKSGTIEKIKLSGSATFGFMALFCVMLAATSVIYTVAELIKAPAIPDIIVFIAVDAALILLSASFASKFKEYRALESALAVFSDIMWTMQQILFMSMDKRLAIFLLDEISKTGADTVKLTHEQIAKYMGSAREVVSRMLKYFASEGMISTSRSEGIRILDKKRLRELTL